MENVKIRKDLIKLAIATVGLSALERESGVSSDTIKSLLYRSSASPSLRTKVGLSRAIGLPLEELFPTERKRGDRVSA